MLLLRLLKKGFLSCFKVFLRDSYLCARHRFKGFLSLLKAFVKGDPIFFLSLFPGVPILFLRPS